MDKALEIPAGPPQRRKKHVVCLIDLGTNAVRMLLVRINANLSYRILSKQRELVRLGEGEFAAQRLQPEAIERTVLVCSRFAEMARNNGASQIIAVATSASREAKNQRRLLRRIEKEAGIDLRIISGKEEARLIYQGVSSGMNLGSRRALFIDVGGGSTELVVGDQHKYAYLDSLKLGAIRLKNMFFSSRDRGPVSLARYAAIQRHIRSTAVQAIRRLSQHKYEMTIGSSGTIETLHQIAQNIAGQYAGKDRHAITREQLRYVVEMLCSLPLDKRGLVPGMSAERADIIVGGAAIFDTLMSDLKIPSIRVSERGLRDGLLIDYIGKLSSCSRIGQLSFRERSVMQLGAAFSFDKSHAATVARLALELFDSGRDAGLHSYGQWEREMLEFAALLHDIGMFLSFDNHHVHSGYFIRSADLLGFDRKELLIMSAIAEFHRKTLPKKKHVTLMALDKQSQQLVRKLCVLLRIAESLDRSRTGVIKNAQFMRDDHKDIVLALKAERDCQLEVWGVKGHEKAFVRVFNEGFRIQLREASVVVAS